MNEVTALEKPVTEVASLLIPVAHDVLLLPTVAVAEIVPYREPQGREDSPSWLLGDAEWRDQTVPVLSFEALCGDKVAGPVHNSRIAVFNNPWLVEELPFVAILTQGIPRLIRVSGDEISGQEEDPGLVGTMRVNVSGESALIPNIEALAKFYLSHR